MGISTPRGVVDLIRDNVFRVRTGLWVLPLNLVGQEQNEAAKLMLDPVDIRKALLHALPENSRFSGLCDQKIMTLIDEISEQEGMSNCSLVYNIDILLAHLSIQEVRNVWKYALEYIPHRSQAILFTIPVTAKELMPSEAQIDVLVREHRFTTTAI